MSDYAHRYTDKEIIRIERDLKKFYDEVNVDNMKQWTEYMDKMGKRVSNAYNDWQNAIKSKDLERIKEAKAEYQRLVKNMTLKDKRYKEMVRDIAKRNVNANKSANAFANERMFKIYAKNYNYQAQQIMKYNKQLKFQPIDEHIIKNMVANGNELLLPQRSLNVEKDMEWNVKYINNQMAKGIYLGESTEAITQRMANVANMNYVQAKRAVRTLATANENKAREQTAIEAEEKGTELYKYWIAHDDQLTREEHVQADVDYSRANAIPRAEPFIVGGEEMMYPADPHGSGWNVYNCRCTMGYVVKGFKKIKRGDRRVKWGKNKD